MSTLGASGIPQFCLNAPTAGGRALFYRLHPAMDRIRKLSLDYSLKNIPIPPINIYRKFLIEKVECVIKRMRWKAFFFLKGENAPEPTDRDDEHFGFKSRKCPPQVEEMKGFEDDLLSIIEGIEVRRASDPFQDRLRKDIEKIKDTDDIIARADKSKSLYGMPKEQYQKLLRDNITRTYKRAPDSEYAEINNEARMLADDLNISERMEVMNKAEAFVTLKDHKERFESDLPCRLINPAKSEMGMVSKAILDKIIQAVRDSTAVNLWKSTPSVVDWFTAIQEKEKHTFICFDVVNFYPSITENLLKEALAFAQQFTTIYEKEFNIIMNARKSLLFSDGAAWMKKDSNSTFDVTMGSYDGAEICELVGAFLLNKLVPHIEKSSIGLYRDDGLGVLRNSTGPRANRLCKTIVSVFKRYGLSVTIDVNLKAVNFLDASFDLTTGKYKPYRKPGDVPLYVHSSSNHPPTILKNIPKAINRRVSSLSADKEVFEEAAPTYRCALAASGFQADMGFLGNKQTANRKTRKRNVLWFNPPYSKNVRTNVAQKFLMCIDKHFPKTSRLSKIFNRNTLKVSYSCLPNMASAIRSHNNSRLKPPQKERPCNCRDKPSCPLNGRCQAEEIIYEAEVTSNAGTKRYVGATAPPFKARYGNHLSSMRNERYKQSTELSKHVWSLKEKQQQYEVTWKISERAKAYNSSSKRCQLCLTEKLKIITADQQTILNKRNDLVSKCRHANKFILANYACIT